MPEIAATETAKKLWTTEVKPSMERISPEYRFVTERPATITEVDQIVDERISTVRAEMSILSEKISDVSAFSGKLDKRLKRVEKQVGSMEASTEKEKLLELQTRIQETNVDLVIAGAGIVTGGIFMGIGFLTNIFDISLVGLAFMALSILHLRARSNYINRLRKEYAKA